MPQIQVECADRVTKKEAGVPGGRSSRRYRHSYNLDHSHYKVHLKESNAKQVRPHSLSIFGTVVKPKQTLPSSNTGHF